MANNYIPGNYEFQVPFPEGICRNCDLFQESGTQSEYFIGGCERTMNIIKCEHEQACKRCMDKFAAQIEEE